MMVQQQFACGLSFDTFAWNCRFRCVCVVCVVVVSLVAYVGLFELVGKTERRGRFDESAERMDSVLSKRFNRFP